jgi:hypothetical protein
VRRRATAARKEGGTCLLLDASNEVAGNRAFNSISSGEPGPCVHGCMQGQTRPNWTSHAATTSFCQYSPTLRTTPKSDMEGVYRGRHVWIGTWHVGQRIVTTSKIGRLGILPGPGSFLKQQTKHAHNAKPTAHGFQMLSGFGTGYRCYFITD